jgi:enoyl-CoA hydratase
LGKNVSESFLKISTPAAGVLKIQINRPKVLNALKTAVLTQIADQLNSAIDDAQIRVVVLTGNEKAFAAGADIDELKQAASGDFPEDERQQAWKAIRTFPKPLIAAVSGFALGGGCELMMAADIVVASRSAQLGQPEINLGIIPGAGGTQVLTRVIGKAASMKLNLTGTFISAREAFDLGLISEVTEPELYLERSIELAENIATKSTVAAQAIKASILKSYELSLFEGLQQEREAFLQIVTGKDAAEGISAFTEKRDANFPSNNT